MSIRTRRIGAELFAALAAWRSALRRRTPPPYGVDWSEARQTQQRVSNAIELQMEARVMALLNDDPGLMDG